MRGKPWFVTDARAWDRWLDVDRGDINEKACALCSLRNLEVQIIEIGDGIRFGPESNLAA